MVTEKKRCQPGGSSYEVAPIPSCGISICWRGHTHHEGLYDGGLGPWTMCGPLTKKDGDTANEERRREGAQMKNAPIFGTCLHEDATVIGRLYRRGRKEGMVGWMGWVHACVFVCTWCSLLTTRVHVVLFANYPSTWVDGLRA